MPLAEIAKHLDGLEPDSLERALVGLERDARQGARALVKKVRRGQAASIAEELRLEGLFRFELSLRAQGYSVVAGVDEVGRGALAGPLVAAAAVLAPDKPILGLKDSKLVDPQRREMMFAAIDAAAECYAIVEISATQIDVCGIQLANMMALRRAVEALSIRCDYVLVDGFQLSGMDMPTLGLVRGDKRSASVAAASIMAKVTRDRFMRAAAEEFPGYGFEEHVGYSTASHVEALRRLGPCPLHRRSFAPVAMLKQGGLRLEE